MPSISAMSPPPTQPEWLVSNGRVTVGPVGTNLLLRGVLHGRVPSSALVRQTGWSDWREVGKIREVSALKRVLERGFDEPALELGSLQDSVEAISQASDAGEALLIALHAVAQVTSATVGLAHRVRKPLWLPTTSCAFEAPLECLGEVLPWSDPAFRYAREARGSILLGSGQGGEVERTLGKRLAPGGELLLGVALLPIVVAGHLHAMLELGRSDHPFRTSDSAELASFVARLVSTLERFGGEPRSRTGESARADQIVGP